MARPRKYDDSTRALLIEESARIIAEAGADALSLRPLANRCGCTTSTIYSLFGGRDQLIEAVIESVVASFTEAQQAVTQTADPLADLRELGLTYRAWALAHPAFYAVMFGGANPPEDDAPPVQTGPASILPLITTIQRVIDAGIIEGPSTELIAASIWASVHGWVTLELAGMTPRGPRAATEAYVEHLRAMVRSWTPGALARTAGARQPSVSGAR